jgi:RHS repeat-associated protein
MVHATFAFGSETVEVVYGPLNRPLARTIDGVTTAYVYDDWRIVGDYTWDSGTDTWAQQRRYVLGEGLDEILVAVSSSDAYYYHYDANGNVSHLTDASGNIVERYEYTAFGETSIFDPAGNSLTQSAIGNRFLYSGRELISPQAVPAIYDLRNRLYHPRMNRFLQMDPIRFAAQDVNLYRYVGNNPATLFDPYGLQKARANNGTPLGSNISAQVIWDGLWHAADSASGNPRQTGGSLSSGSIINSWGSGWSGGWGFGG